MWVPTTEILVRSDSPLEQGTQNQLTKREGRETLLGLEHTKTKESAQVSSNTTAPLNSESTLKRGSIPIPTPEVIAEKENQDIVLFTNRKRLICLSVRSIPSKQKLHQDLGIMILNQTLVPPAKKENETTKSTAWSTSDTTPIQNSNMHEETTFYQNISIY